MPLLREVVYYLTLKRYLVSKSVPVGRQVNRDSEMSPAKKKIFADYKYFFQSEISNVGSLGLL